MSTAYQACAQGDTAPYKQVETSDVLDPESLGKHYVFASRQIASDNFIYAQNFCTLGPAPIKAVIEMSNSMANTFTAHNDLEEKLVAAQEGSLQTDIFMQQLLDQQLFMPVQDEASEIQGFQRSTKAKPLTVEAEDGTPVLVLFTSPERAKPFLQDFPDYGGGLLSEFSWILDRIGSGVAIAINPGIEFGIDLEADNVTQLIHLNASRKAPPQASS